MESNISFKTKPFSHQLKEFIEHKEDRTRALLWEQGTGKSKVILDSAAWLYVNNKIDGLLIIAPNGVHRNWIVDQIPQHYPLPQKTLFMWESKKANNKNFKQDFRTLMKNPRGLAILTMNYEALITDKGKLAAESFLDRYKSLLVCDESHKIKSWKAKRTKNIVKIGKLAKYKRILTGTVIGNSAFDLYSQFRFLNENILGFKSEYAFKARFGVFIQTYANGRHFNQLIKYRNLDQLKKLIDPYAIRITKEEVLDLPDKLYQKRYFDMSPRQAKIYSDLKREYLVELKEGKVLTAPLALTRLLRLQQITCNYLPIEGEMLYIETKNPRIECLMEALESCEGKIIIWARFTEDIRQIKSRLELDTIEFVEYYGDIREKDRLNALEQFTKNPNCKIFLANPACAGEGLNLQVATAVIYYSNSFKLIERLQSEDRAHRIGQNHKVTYIDIICPDTVDDRIVKTLRKNQNIATTINGDKLKEWI